MTLSEIKAAVEAGITVYWSNVFYQVVKNSKNQELYIKHSAGHMIGLTRADGVTMNAEEADFFSEIAK